VIAISCREPDWQLSAIEQVCNSYSRALSTIKHLYIEHDSKLVWKNDAIEKFLWLQLLHPFTAVKNLYLSKESAPGIAAALEDLVGGQNNRSVPQPEEYLPEVARAIGTLSGQPVCCLATAL
jgi:hypothetical protein